MSTVPIIRITADGSWRVTTDGAVRITGFGPAPSPPPEPVPPVPDIATAIDVYLPGIVVQATLTEAMAAWLIEHDGVVGAGDVGAILANANAILATEIVTDREPVTQEPYPLVLPPYPSGLVRFPDSNPAPDGWSIANSDKVVRG